MRTQVYLKYAADDHDKFVTKNIDFKYKFAKNCSSTTGPNNVQFDLKR